MENRPSLNQKSDGSFQFPCTVTKDTASNSFLISLKGDGFFNSQVDIDDNSLLFHDYQMALVLPALVPNSSVLCVGVGGGSLMSHVKLVTPKVIGLEQSKSMLDLAVSLNFKHGSDVVLGDACNIHEIFDGKLFDFIQFDVSSAYCSNRQLYSQDYLTSLLDRLTENGSLAFNLSGVSTEIVYFHLKAFLELGSKKVVLFSPGDIGDVTLLVLSDAARECIENTTSHTLLFEKTGYDYEHMLEIFRTLL